MAADIPKLPSADSDRLPVLWALAGLGLASVMTQLALMRELLCAFAGNEMVLGITLGLWLLLTGLGTSLGRTADKLRNPLAVLFTSQIFIAVIPLAQVFAVRALRNVVFVRGAEVGVMGTVLSAAVLLLPFCLVAGYTLTLACSILARIANTADTFGVPPSGGSVVEGTQDTEMLNPQPPEGGTPNQAAGRVYVADSLGSVAGGALFSFVLVRFLDHIALLAVPALLNLAAAALLGRAGWRSNLLGAPVSRRPRGIAAIIPQGRPVGSRKLEHSGETPALPGTEPLNRSSRREPALTSLWIRWSGLTSAATNPLGREILILTLVAGIAAFVWLVNADALSTSLQFPGQNVLFRANSPYGRLVVTESGGETNFIENGIAVVSTPNVEQVEEAAHYAMSQRPGARRVLLVSGGVAGVSKEILKYNVAGVDCVELDPLVIETGHRFLPDHFADPRIHVIATDARQFVRQTTNRYDVVILALPDPSTAQLNRFFTVEFFSGVKRVLADGGVLSFALGRYENYVSPELAQLLASADRSLQPSFANILALPGGRVFFLASDGPLHGDIAARVEAQGVPTKLVNRHYLDAMLTADRMADIQRAVSQPAALNRDFSPMLYFYHLRHWMSQFTLSFGALQAMLLLLLLVYLIRLRGPALVLFASGFAGSALEVVLLLAFQVLCGSVYHQVGVIVTVFMAGLALGAAWANHPAVRPFGGASLGVRSSAFRRFSAIEPPEGGTPNQADAARSESAPDQRQARCLSYLAFAIAALALLLPALLFSLNRLNNAVSAFVVIQAVIALLTLILAMLAGAQFPLANQLQFDGTAAGVSRLYTADFVGASLGALLASTLLIPLIGVTGVCLLTAALNALAGGVLFWRKVSI
jgi:spermidine synthase